MKKLWMLLALLLALGMTGAWAEEADEPIVYTSGEWEYVLLEDGTAEITSHYGEAEELTVPAEIDGYAVTGIGFSTFNNYFNPHSSMTSITIPDSVTVIEGNPFTSCDSLTDIIVSIDHPTLATIDGVLFNKTEKKLVCYPVAYTNSSYAIPQGIRVIGDYAFSNNNALTSITIPDSVTTIENGAFSVCQSLTNVSIPDSVTHIGDGAFSGCRSLTSVSIPDSVTYLGGAFDWCYALASISLPDSITTIGDYAFYACKSLTSITIPDSVTTIENDAFNGCFALKSVTIPDSVTFIGDNAFDSCTSLTSITIPDSVTSIGESTFQKCTSLTAVTLPASLTSIANNAFADCGDITFTVPRDSYARQWCKDNGYTYTYPDALDWLND